MHGFILSKRGATDPKYGTIKGSVQEDSYFEEYATLLDYLRNVKQNNGDLYGEILEKSVQFTMDANQRFFEKFSELLQMRDVVRILPTYSDKTHVPTTNYRACMLDAWKNADKFLEVSRKSGAKVLKPLLYSDFGEVYKRSIDEMMKILSLPTFGESDDDKKGEEEPEL